MPLTGKTDSDIPNESPTDIPNESHPKNSDMAGKDAQKDKIEEEIDDKTFKMRVLTMLGKMNTDIIGVKNQVENMDGKVGDMTRKLSSLETEVGRQNKCIQGLREEVNAIATHNEKQSDRLEAVENDMRALRDEVKAINQVKENAPRHLLVLKYELDRQEQYTRKDSIRIVGLSEDENETDAELRTKIVTLAATAGLDEMTAGDISVTHRLGARKPGSTRPVICKFTKRKLKHDLLKCKKHLKKEVGYRNVYISEDLTSIRAKMFKMIRQNEKVKSAHTRDGKIICMLKDGDRERIVTIDTPDDLFKLGYNQVDLDKLGLKDFSAPYRQPNAGGAAP